ncbi:hypothetical protein MMC34_007275 [Xylographa carneopallida]|nr:hypothetical protein [Xylographa carneopallida]
MRSKVYGKKGRPFLGNRPSVFEQDSPKASHGKGDDNAKAFRLVLKERSGNLGRGVSGEKDAYDAGQELDDCKTKCRIPAPHDTAKSTEQAVIKKHRIEKNLLSAEILASSVITQAVTMNDAALLRESAQMLLENDMDAVGDLPSFVLASAVDKLGLKESLSRPRTKNHQTSSPHSIDEVAMQLQDKLVITESPNFHHKSITPVRVYHLEIIPAFHEHPAPLDIETAAYVSPLLACRNVSGTVENFQAWTDVRMPSLKMQKIGEGSFGEVYRAASGGETVIIKIIPLNARKGRGSRTFTSIEAAANEIQLLEKMQRIPGFVEFRGACVLQGYMPSQIVKEWNNYKVQGRTVESRDPNKRIAYSENQLWLVIEMSDAGTNLNPGHYLPCAIKCYKPGDRYLSVHRSWDIFWQIVRALAKAEVYAEFEHRDLHLGNICARNIGTQDDKEDLTLVPSAEPTPVSLDNTGVQVTIIDYSLARAIADEDRILSYDFMKNDSLLRGEGDLQYDIYRYMAEAIGKKNSKEFVPKTNVLWLSYLITKLLDVTAELSEEAKFEEMGRVTVTAKMKAILEEVREITDVSRRQNWVLRSAGDLLELGTCNRWFSVEEIIDG